MRLSTTNAEGVLRLTSDVVIQSSSDQEMVVLSHGPYSVGERLTVDLVATRSRRSVQVADSRPVMIDGCVQHQVRLTFTDEA